MKQDHIKTWRRHRTTAAERQEWVRQFDMSGLSRQDFARQHGLGVSTLDRWRREDQPPAAEVAEPPALRELSFGPVSPEPAWVAEARRPDGLTVRWTAQLPEAWWHRLLGGPC